MKKILGKVYIFLALTLLPLHAGYQWEVKIDKNSYYQNEAFLVTFLCHFDNRSPDMYIEFKPKLKGFEFERLDFSNRVIEGKREVRYRYFAKAKEQGIKAFSLPVLMRQTTDESIRETVLGRDNDQDLVFVDTKIQTPLKKITIMPIPKEAEMVGSFKIDIGYSKDTLQAYEPLQLKVTISGKGDFKALKAFEFPIQNVKLFQQEPQSAFKMTQEGYVGKVIWRYALTSDHDFILPEKNIYYFDATMQKIQRLHFPQKKIIVTGSLSKDKILDQENYPQADRPFDWVGFGEKLFYFVLGALFISVIAKMKKMIKKRPKKDQKHTNINDLLTFLVKNTQYHELLQTLENDIKNKKVKKLDYYVMQLDKEDRR